jgi:hypothetical protein
MASRTLAMQILFPSVGEWRRKHASRGAAIPCPCFSYAYDAPDVGSDAFHRSATPRPSQCRQATPKQQPSFFWR